MPFCFFHLTHRELGHCCAIYSNRLPTDNQRDLLISVVFVVPCRVGCPGVTGVLLLCSGIWCCQCKQASFERILARCPRDVTEIILG